jgi:hypothetical protein
MSEAPDTEKWSTRAKVVIAVYNCAPNHSDVEGLAMAKETVTRLVDDLDGGVAHETVRFELDGHLYEIDLSSKNAKKLRNELAMFVEHGSRVRAAPGRRGARATARAAQPDQSRAIREWALAKGYDIAPRGRIKQEIVDAYYKKAGR